MKWRLGTVFFVKFDDSKPLYHTKFLQSNLASYFRTYWLRNKLEKKKVPNNKRKRWRKNMAHFLKAKRRCQAPPLAITTTKENKPTSIASNCKDNQLCNIIKKVIITQKLL